jgi:hypothetical protein
MAVPTEPVDNQKDFASQLHQLKRGIATAAALRRWLLSNHELVTSWQALVEASKDARPKEVYL